MIDALRTDLALRLAYFYFDFKDPSKKDCRGLVSSLVFQIGTSSGEGTRYLQNIQEQCGLGDLPVYEDLLNVLSHLLLSCGCVFVVIDALDECSRSKRREELLPFLKRIVALNIDQLRLLVTSRPEADITRFMASILTHEASLHDIRDQACALARHVEERLANVEDYPEWSEALRVQARDVIVSKAGGM